MTEIKDEFNLKKSVSAEERKSDPDDVNPDKLIIWARNVFISAIALAGVLIIYYVFNFRGEPHVADVGKWGQVGDFIGGTLNPLIGGATIFLLLIGLQVQRRELRDTSEALKLANQFAAQQAFEQSLFSWLENCRELINAMEADVYIKKDGRFIDEKQTFKGKALLRTWYDKNLTLGWEKNYNIMSIDESENEKKEALAHMLGRKIDSYNAIFRENRSELDAYLRTMFRLFEWIDGDQHTLTPKQRWHYASLVRGQISWSELVIHFYNGFTTQGKAFVEYYERYAFFDNIKTGKDYLIDSVSEGFIKQYSKDFGRHSIPYTEMAFSSDLARKNLRI